MGACIETEAPAKRLGKIRRGEYRGIVNSAGEKEGYGIFVYDNEDVYQGEWKKNKKHGKGMYRFKEGDVYDGDFFEGRREGEGVLMYSIGEEYIGGFGEDKFNGEGMYTYDNGCKYSGGFKNNLKHGEGVYVFTNGIVYTGKFEEGDIVGVGMLSYTSEDETTVAYAGYYANGEFTPISRSKNALNKLQAAVRFVKAIKPTQGVQEEGVDAPMVISPEGLPVSKQYHTEEEVDEEIDLEAGEGASKYIEEGGGHPLIFANFGAPTFVSKLEKNQSFTVQHVALKQEFNIAAKHLDGELKIKQGKSKHSLVDRLQQKKDIKMGGNSSPLGMKGPNLDSIQDWAEVNDTVTEFTAAEERLLFEQARLKKKQHEILEKRLKLYHETKELGGGGSGVTSRTGSCRGAV